MKWVFIFLLLVNVFYFAWELDRQTKMDITYKSSIPALSGLTRQLKFLRELDTAPVPRKVETGNPMETRAEPAGAELQSSVERQEDAVRPANREPAASMEQLPDFDVDSRQKPATTGACFSFGPIASEAQANDLHDWFVARGGQAELRYRDKQGRQLFWVYLSPQDSRQEAMKTIRSFQDKNIRDFRLIIKGNLQNAISMGLFSSQASVNERLRELQKKGYKPVVVPYFDGKRAYWIDARVPQDKKLLEKVFNDYPSRFNSVPIRCGEIAKAANY